MIGKLRKLKLSLSKSRLTAAPKMASLEKLLLERRSITAAELAELQELNRQNEN